MPRKRSASTASGKAAGRTGWSGGVRAGLLHPASGRAHVIRARRRVKSQKTKKAPHPFPLPPGEGEGGNGGVGAGGWVGGRGCREGRGGRCLRGERGGALRGRLFRRGTRRGWRR